MSWMFFALLSVLLFSISSLLQRVLMKEEQSDAHAYSIAFQLLGAVVVGVFAITQGFEFPPIDTYPVNFLLLAVLYGTGTLCLFNAYKHLGASEVTIITSSRTIVTIISAVLILNEVFDLQKAAGTILILTSILVISDKIGKIKLDKGFFYALGMSVCYGLAITNDTFLLSHVNVYSFTTIGFLLPGLFLILVNPKKIKKLNTFFKTKVFLKLLLMTASYGIAALLFYSAINHGATASQITPILQSTVIITVILAMVFLKERTNILKKCIGATLVTIGVILLA